VSPGGLIAGLQVGSAVVTATSLDGGFSATCDVTVATAATAVTGIALSAPPTEIFLGACQQLSFTIQPPEATDQRVTWASSDEAVARVSATGVVQPLSLGSVEITVTTVDGGHSDGCTVEVKPPVAVTGVSLDPSSAVLEVGDPPLQLQAVIEPANATVQTVSWSTSNDEVAAVASSGPTSGEVTAVNAGTVVITAEVDDGAGGVFEESCTVTVKGVYVAGYVDVGGVSNGAYWVVTSSGNVRTDLPSSGSTWARDVCVVDGEVFVSGNHDGAELGTPCYWKNATRYDLPMSGDTLGAACGIVRDGSDVLVAGLRSSGTTFTACDWRITPGDPDIVERVDLATATTEDPTKLGAGGLGVDVAGGSVYVSGALVNSGTGVQEACYWQDNGTTIDHTVLHDRDHDPPYVASVAYGIVVKPGHVYVCGFQDDGSDPKQWDGYYWVDETPNPIEGDHCEPYALWVSSSGTVYIAGVESGTGCYWVDGVQQELLPAGYAYGITFQGDDLYISGDTGSGTPAAKACFWKNGAHHELDSPDTSGAVFIRAF
jgi:hypothetical protein